MFRRYFLVGLFIAVTAFAGVKYSKDGTITSEKGFCPDERTAVSIAQAVWQAIKSEKDVQARTFTAKSSGQQWAVESSFRQPTLDGGLLFEIDKKDCRIRSIKVQ